jgi:hypothetical protein
MNMPSHFELDDLKLGLQTLDCRLEIESARTHRLLDEVRIGSVRARLRPLGIGQMIQLVAGCAAALIFGRFWVAHLSEPHLMICGLLLHGFSLMVLAFAVRDLACIGRIDYSGNVLDVQRQLAQLQAWHLRRALWTTVTGCFMWVPLLLAVFSGWGVDIWVVKPSIMYWNIAISFLCLGMCYTLVRCSKRPGWERLAEYLRQSIAGRSLTQAQAALIVLDEFERN